MRTASLVFLPASVLIAATLLFSACATATEDDTPSDAGRDTGSDAASKDSGTHSSRDSATVDADETDAAVAIDASVADSASGSDAASADSGFDSGPRDAGTPNDAGVLPLLTIPAAVGDTASLDVTLSPAGTTLPTLRTTSGSCPAALFTGTRSETTYAYVKIVNTSNQPKKIVLWQSPKDVTLNFLELAVYASDRAPSGDAERLACTYGPAGDCAEAPCTLPNSRNFAGLVGANAFTVPAQSSVVAYNAPSASAAAGLTGTLTLNVKVVP